MTSGTRPQRELAIVRSVAALRRGNTSAYLHTVLWSRGANLGSSCSAAPTPSGVGHDGPLSIVTRGGELIPQRRGSGRPNRRPRGKADESGILAAATVRSPILSAGEIAITRRDR